MDARTTGSFEPLFNEYQKNLKLDNAVDFDDLIMLPLQLLSTFPEVRQEYHERYRYLLVDEFQDTSSAQYELMRLLVGPAGNVCVVGDDDQSIYSWRGASYENILRFEKDFPRRQGDHPRAELPLHQDHPAGRQRPDHRTTPSARRRRSGRACPRES